MVSALTTFFGVASVDAWHVCEYGAANVAYRPISQRLDSDSFSLAAWLRLAAEIDAAGQPCADYRQSRAACETPGAGGLAQSSILLVNTHSPWIADWMPAPEDRRHAERWK